MGTVALACQVLLTVVFATAGFAKLVDQPGSRRALAEFGVPAPALPASAWLLPVVEIATAVALVIHDSARWGAVAAVVLLLAFVGGISRALSQGQTPDCHCFGQLHSAPAGRGALARNAGLAVAAALVVVHGPGPAIDAWMAARSAAELVAVGLGISATVLAALSARLWLENKELRTELRRAREASAALPPGLPVGSPAPSFTLRDQRGETVTLDSLRARGRPVALLFVGPQCGPCNALFADLGSWQAALAERVTIALISTGSVRDNRVVADNYGIASVLVQDGSEVMESYRVRATPTAIMVNADGRVASAPAETVYQIEPLIRLALRSKPTVEPGLVLHQG